jgi:hypothetical protein
VGNISHYDTEPETVKLEEKGETLDLLLRFMYCQAQPDVESLEFEQLCDLAGAVEKYAVHSAIQVCKMAMK